MSDGHYADVKVPDFNRFMNDIGLAKKEGVFYVSWSGSKPKAVLNPDHIINIEVL